MQEWRAMTLASQIQGTLWRTSAGIPRRCTTHDQARATDVLLNSNSRLHGHKNFSLDCPNPNSSKLRCMNLESTLKPNSYGWYREGECRTRIINDSSKGPERIEILPLKLCQRSRVTQQTGIFSFLLSTRLINSPQMQLRVCIAPDLQCKQKNKTIAWSLDRRAEWETTDFSLAEWIPHQDECRRIESFLSTCLVQWQRLSRVNQYYP